MTFFDYVRSSGIIGMLVIVATLALLAFGLVGLVSHGRRSPGMLLALALLPVGLGALGMWLGYRQVFGLVAMSGGSASPQDIAHGLTLARGPLVMEAIGGGLVAVLALIGMFVTPSGDGGEADTLP